MRMPRSEAGVSKEEPGMASKNDCMDDALSVKNAREVSKYNEGDLKTCEALVKIVLLEENEADKYLSRND